MKMQEVSDARNEDILFMFDMGEYLPRIAERVGLNIDTVKNALRRHGRDPSRGLSRVPHYRGAEHLGGSKWKIEGHVIEQRSSREWRVTNPSGESWGFTTFTEAQEWVTQHGTQRAS